MIIKHKTSNWFLTLATTTNPHLFPTWETVAPFTVKTKEPLNNAARVWNRVIFSIHFGVGKMGWISIMYINVVGYMNKWVEFLKLNYWVGYIHVWGWFLGVHHTLELAYLIMAVFEFWCRALPRHLVELTGIPRTKFWWFNVCISNEQFW